MTETEGKIAQWLDNKRINYNFQSSLMGGRSELAGMVIPFIVPDFNLALRIRNQDLYDGVSQTAIARIERAQLHNLGFVVVDAHEEDITRNVDEVMNRAIEGREMSDLDSDLWFPYMGMFKGIPTFAGITSIYGGYGPPDPSTVVAGTVQTDAATGEGGGAETTDSFYPSTDSNVAHVDVTYLTWAEIINGTGTGHWHYGSVAINSSAGALPLWYEVDRTIIIFDTSALPDICTITATILYLYGEQKRDQLSITPDICICDASGVGDTIEATDYALIGSAKYSLPMTYALFNATGYNSFTLNATGLAGISKTGLTRLGVRNDNYDIQGVTPSWLTNQISDFQFYLKTETADTTKWPILSVTYTTPLSGTVTLHGTLAYDGGGDCSVRFQFGTTTSYGTDSIWQTGKLTGATFTSQLSGLTIGETYHFRAQARNKHSTVNGADKSFVY